MRSPITKSLLGLSPSVRQNLDPLVVALISLGAILLTLRITLF